MSKELYIDNFRLTAYRTAAEKVMQIADDRERMQQIGRLVSKILTERPLMKQCMGMLYYRYYPNMEAKTPHNPQDRSIKLRWDDYKAYYDNPDEGLLTSWMGDYVDEDIVNKWKNEPVPAPPEWLDDFEPPFDENGNIVGDNDHITELTALLDALQTEYDLLAAINSLTQATTNTAAGNNTGGDEITPPEAEKQHFNGYKSDKAYADLLEELQNAGLVPQHTTAAAWLWVCKGTPLPADEHFEPVNWLGTQNKLGLLIETLFGGISEAPTKACFTVKGKTPNVGSMRVERSKIKDDTSSNSKEEPKTHKALLKILAVWNAQSK